MRFWHPFLFLIVIFLLSGLVSCASFTDIPPADSEPETADRGGASEYTGALVFDGRRYTYTGDAGDICAEDDRLIIKKGGIYVLSGRIDEGRIAVECDGEVALFLDGFEASSSYGALIERTDGGSLALSASADTTNLLTSTYVGADGVLPTGCIRTTGELRIFGEGRLTVSAREGSGVVANDLRISGGELNISCKTYGIWARDSISMTDGGVTVACATVGLYAYGGEYCEGRIDLLGGRLTAVCKEQAMLAEGELTVGDTVLDTRIG